MSRNLETMVQGLLASGVVQRGDDESTRALVYMTSPQAWLLADVILPIRTVFSRREADLRLTLRDKAQAAILRLSIEAPGVAHPVVFDECEVSATQNSIANTCVTNGSFLSAEDAGHVLRVADPSRQQVAELMEAAQAVLGPIPG